MAVDLTPRFTRLNSQTRRFSENLQLACHAQSGPFRATQLWRNIIQALQTQVEVKRRRHHLRIHSDCFTGSDAVDVVLSYLMQNVMFSSSEVSRLKATRLCQALMEARVFEPVGIKLFRREKEMAFEDSSCSLYRFLDCNALPGSAKCHDPSEAMSLEMGANRKRMKASRLDEVRTITNPLAFGSSDRRVERILHTLSLQPCMPSISTYRGSSNSLLSKTEVQEVWEQQTLLQLLQLVELPVLDRILSPPGTPGPRHARLWHHHDDLVISNTRVDREMRQSLHLPELDAWLVAAVDCLELFPDQLIVGVGEQLLQLGGAEESERLGAQKKLLFETIAKFYSHQEKPPLLPARYVDIHAGILQLLDRKQMADAERASSLCLQLLESSTRDELRRLLRFLAAAASPGPFRLQKQAENRVLVSRTFAKAVAQSQEMTRSQSEQLLLFLMDNHANLFKAPVQLVEAVRKTLHNLQQGRDPDKIAIFTFCEQVTLQQYEEQREKATLDSLKQLVTHITLSDSLSTKERKRLVRSFQRHHPVVFMQHLSSSS